jgi:hypothetical protein
MTDNLTLAEFRKIYTNKSKEWDFNLFKIVCIKCYSTEVEFASNIEVGAGYYGCIEKDGEIIIKCHNCGNAHKINIYDLEK